MKRGMRGKLNTFMFTFDDFFHLGQKDQFILVGFILFIIDFLLLVNVKCNDLNIFKRNFFKMKK